MVTTPPPKKTREKEKKFESPYGYFTEDGMEFVITRPDTPRPWVNVISNGDYGVIESQTGSGFSWLGNSNLSRIVRWEQDLIKDDWGKYLYLRDRASGEVWSGTWKPCMSGFDFFEVRHGLGYSVLASRFQKIKTEKTIFVDAKDPVEIWRVRLTNEDSKPRRLSVFSYFEWCLGNAADTHREFHKTFIETQIDRAHHVIYGLKRPALVPGHISTGLSESPLEAFHAAHPKPVAYEGDKEAFFGRYGPGSAPAAVKKGRLSNSDGKWGDSIASLQIELDLAPGQTQEVVFLLGAVRSRKESETLIQKFSAPGSAEKELQAVKALWRKFVEASWIETPDEAMNLMTNVWLKYQTLSGRLWARCGYYQSSGGFGFRDQLQDSQIFLPLEPALCKKQILLHAGHQFPDGTVYHWWHPGTGIGAVTHMTDDLLWLVFLTLAYLDETADESVLNEKVKFLPDPKTKQVTEAGLYDHCLRAIDKVFSRWSPRGLPLIGEGDWNDGLSHVGVRWKGESIWLGQFLYGVLKRFNPYVKKRDPQRSEDYEKRAEALKEAINRHGWDGEWYVGATGDDGRPLGSKTSGEGKIFLNAQTWAVISGVATPERGRACMASAEKLLYKEYGPLLLTPAYTVTDPGIGYITRYAPALRENGGVYTHAANWAVQAECILRDGEKAHQVYQSYSPPCRGLDPERYYVEPYVTPGNVDGPESPHESRGGWTWYTGSAQWCYTVAMNWILGVRPVREGLLIDPVIPKSWPGFQMRRQFRGATYEIEVKNPSGASEGVKTVRVDGKPHASNVIPAFGDGSTHKVEVLLGR
ncbi:MAG: glycosyl transferase family 36 [Candidatus Omnitrophica bacterium]|nr:glycosyl transferase family 36 [Candidatus Omnitrophota bacterium]